jgi:hypothetical protein
MALSSAVQFLDEFRTFRELSVQCMFQILSDSTGAISALEHIRDQIPTRHYPDHADVVSTLKDAIHKLAKSVCQHAKATKMTKKTFRTVPFLHKLMSSYAIEWLHVTWTTIEKVNGHPDKNQPVVISIMGQNIPSQYIKRLRNAITSDAHCTYFQQRYRM